MKKFIRSRNYSLFVLVLVLTLLCGLISCRQKERFKIKQKVLTISKHTLRKTFYFSGTIEPLRKIPVFTPSNGIILNTFFKFGNEVKKGDLLFTINIAQQSKECEKAIMDYFAKKQKLTNDKMGAETSVYLYKQGVISRDEYNQAQVNYDLDQLEFIQSEKNLETLLQKWQFEKIKKLSFKEIPDIISALKISENNILKIYAPASGVVLSSKNNNSQQGAKIKAGDVLVYLGDMSGISTHIKVPETDINQFYKKQKATITSAFDPSIVLEGQVESINFQAESGGSLPFFLAEIVAPKLTAKIQKIVHIGMDVNVAVKFLQKKQILIPIKSVFQKNDGANYVNKFDENSKNIKEVFVKPGRTTEDLVSIKSGLKVGDKIQVPI